MDDDLPSLRKQLPQEYQSWLNMRRRAKTDGAVVHSDFDTFEGFYQCLRRKPDPTYTLDRIDPSDPEYAPGKVRWASKQQQSNNRSNTSFLTYDGVKYSEYKGLTKPLTDWAAITARNPGTLRRRKSEGWTDTEIIDGVRARRRKVFEEMSKGELLNYQPWPEESKREDEFRFTRERRTNETRFAFDRRLVEAEELREIERDLNALAEDCSGEPEAFEDVPDDLIYRGWILRDHSLKDRFSELCDEHRHALTKLDESRRQEDRWRSAVERQVKVPIRQARIAKELERHFRDQASDADSDLYDEEGYRLDD